MITIYWSPIISYFDDSDSLSELRYSVPTPLIKEIDHQEFFGEFTSRCPAISDELKNTFVIKSPLDIDIEIDYENRTAKTLSNIDEQYFIRFLTPPNEERVHQMADPAYIFFTEADITMTQLHPYYAENNFTENAMGISGTYNISKWVRPVRPAFKFKKGMNSINLKEGDHISYFKFNTNEKIRMVKFDANALMSDPKHIVLQCTTFKEVKKNKLLPTPLKKCYDAFVNARFKQKMIKYIKENEL
jgi:hypothetical protein